MWSVVGATELIIKFKPKVVERQNFLNAYFESAEDWLWKKFGFFSVFDMILKAILCVQQFCCNVIHCM